jgi:asparagine synthase (glutamine-hydrolysing)
LSTREAAPFDAESAAPALFHGVLHNQRDLSRSASAPGRPGESVESLIQRLYDTDGDRCLSQFEGEFTIAIADTHHGRVLVATDPVGSYPIYWRADANGFIFSSDLSALLKATPGATRLDLRAVADYLTAGAVLGDRTLAEGVRLLGPGTILSYELASGRVDLRQYVDLADWFGPRGLQKAEYLEALRQTFRTAVTRAADTTLPVGLSLSGGLDSRAILSALQGRLAGVHTYTLGVEGCADQIIADKLARIAGTQHRYFPLDASYLRDFLPSMTEMVSLTDGMYLSHGLTEMLAVRFLDQSGIAVLLRGHGGELAKAHLAWPYHTDARVYAMSHLSDLVPYLSARANYVTPNLPLSSFLTPPASQAAGRGSADAFAEALRDKRLSPAEACSYLYLMALNRRFTVPSIELLRTRVEVRLPFLDAGFLRVLLAAPPEWRDSTDIHRALTAMSLPALLSVRNSNTGAPANAGRLTEFVLDKANTVLKRLNVRGYRHYHNFDDWMRRMLNRAVEAELLAPGARVQGFVQRSALESLVRESRAGAAERSYVLQVLLILELWQRENDVDAWV